MNSILTAVGILVLSIPAAADSAARKPFPKTAFALPMVDGLKLDWVFFPGDAALASEKGMKDAAFDVDQAGNPWFVDGARRYLASPKQDLMFRSAVPFEGFLYLDGKEMISCDDHNLTALQVAKGVSEKKVPVMESVALMKLDQGDCRLFPGAKGTLYVAVRDQQGRDEIWSVSSAPPKPPKIRRLLRLAGPRITALAGDGDTFYYAVGKSIYEFKDGASAPALYFTLPEEVRSIAYSKEAGLFYSTTNHVGFLGPKFEMKFITSPEPRIALRGTDLYIRLSMTMAVVKVSRADLFGTLRMDSDTSKKP